MRIEQFSVFRHCFIMRIIKHVSALLTIVHVYIGLGYAQTSSSSLVPISDTKTCKAPSQPQNGHWKLHRSQCLNTEQDCDISEGINLGLGSYLIYSCNPGYKIKGSMNVSCIEGKWLNIPSCIEIRCQKLSTASIIAHCIYNNEWVSCDYPVLPGTSAKLSCRDSYQYESNLPSRRRNFARCNKNGQWVPQPIICVPATGQVVTSITLDHTLYRSSVLPHPQNSYDSPQQNLNTNFKPNIFLSTPQPTVAVYTSTLQTSITQRSKKPLQRPTTFSEEIDNNPFLKPSPVRENNECGISNQPITNNNPLISKRMKTLPGQWPWLVALFLVRIYFEFQCAGSILTQKHVITAAHCLKLDAQTNIPPSAMLASLGRYRLQEWHEAGSLNIEIASYTLHPDYNHQGSGDSDLAILTLRTPVEFSSRIKPICMWYDSTDLQSVVNKAGYVVGWGKDELGNPYVQEPRMARVPIVSQESCLWSDQNFIKLTSNRTFCAGMRDGSGPCNGDAGSGLMLYDPSTGRYQLRGIVSRTLFDSNLLTCDLTQYVVYVDVAKYLSWIYQQISM